MRKLIINSVEETIPPYPSAKDYVYRCAQFFGVHSMLGYVKSANYNLLTEMANARRYHCAIPRDILLDPTNACNMSCRGCWANDYRNAAALSFERWDSLLDEAKSIGALDILYTGGEPLMRKKELLMLARKHNKMFFGVFTNGTLIDEHFVSEIKELGNVLPFVSIEGYREETDFRRGAGAYDNILRAMRLLKEQDVPFGFSLCYHKRNFELLTSDAYLDFLRESGAWMGWAFGYRPIGADADMSLTLNADERYYVFRRLEEYSRQHDFVLIDLFNSGHKIFGCVGAGHGYLHINAAGDVEPCAFCHYSDSNINDMTLAEAIGSPFMRAFRRDKPFSENPLAPCPVYDNPEIMVKLCQETGARSTHAGQSENAENFAAKVGDIAAQWQEFSAAQYPSRPRGEQTLRRHMTKNLEILKKLAGDDKP